MRGLIRATYFYNKQQAISDWQKVVEFAVTHDCRDLLPEKFDPLAAGVGVRRIDNEIDKARAAMKERGIDMPEVYRLYEEIR